MQIIVCVDEKGGMSFAGRRQSRDKVLCEKVQEMTAGNQIWLREYSAKIFPDQHNLRVCEDYLHLAPAEDWCFVETEDLTAFVDKIRRVIVYRWNRQYPSDLKFPEEALGCRWELESRREFAGSSHDCITEEVYRL